MKQATSKKKDWIVYILLIVSVIGLGFYTYHVKNSHMGKEIEFQSVEEPQSEIVGIWNELIKEEAIQRRMIFTDTTYTLLLQDGVTPDENTVLETGQYTFIADGTIKLEASNPEDKVFITSCWIQTPENKHMTTIDMGDQHRYFFGIKASNQTDQMQESDAQSEKNTNKTMVYISPDGQ
jgi:hypothetical protein